jgi:chromosome segregation protein
MRVKKLEIFGFKSFATKESIHFGPGITGVVGPNGCGKSNVVDALRWVMGEQNARHLRGGQMSDIIFCGAEKKAALGFAEVTLTLENDSQNVPLEYSNFAEIQITRRLYKSGDSEYEINKQKTRLKDITDFFLGTGVGTKAYSIIEQGRVNEVVSAKPIDRRNLIEEAAGITKYKAKKAAAERRMEDTRVNLNRIIDIKNEIQKRVNALIKEKEKLSTALSLKNTIRDLDLHLACHQFLGLNATAKFFQTQMDALQGQKRQLFEEQSFLQHAFDKILSAYDEKSEQKILLDQLIFQHQSSKELAAKDREFCIETLNNNHTLLQRIDGQLGDLNHRSKSLLADAVRHEEEARAAQVMHEQILKELAQINENGQSLLENRNNSWRKTREITTSITEQSSKAARLQGQINGLENQEKQTALDLKNHLAETDAKSQDLSALVEHLASIVSDIAEGQANIKKLDDEAEALQVQYLAQKSVSEELTQKLQQLRKVQVETTSRLRSLQEIEAELKWSECGVAALWSRGEREHILGMVADVLSPKAGEETLVENTLAQMLDTAIVKDRQAMTVLMGKIREGKLSSSNFVCLSQMKAAGQQVAAFGLPNLTQFVALKDDSYRALMQLLQFYFVAADLEEAFQHWPHAQALGVGIVTRAGVALLPTGQAKLLMASSEQGVLRRRSELEALSAELEVVSSSYGEAERELATALEKLKSLELAKKAVIDEVKPLSLALARLEENHRQKLYEQKRLESDLAARKARLEDLSARSVGFATSIANLRIEWEQAIARHLELENEQIKLKEAVDQIEEAYQSYQDQIKTCEIKKATTQEALKSSKAAMGQAEQNIAHIKQQEAQFLEQMGTIRDEELILQEKQRQAEVKMVALEKELLQTSMQQREIALAVLELQAEKNAGEMALGAVRNQAKGVADAISALSQKISDVQKDVDLLVERIRERHQTYLLDHLIDFHHRPLNEAQAKKTIEENKKALDKVGPVNENAANEYDAYEQRLNFLVGQISDLESALLQLESAIKKINKTTKARFMEAFTAINRQFSQVFPRLFNGGKAELVLTNEEDILLSGVDIIARPPGKNIGSIELMSGGEKALTAISLIMAIFLIKPSPFCLLDEVDAPLDEANVTRFSQLIKEMSELSQFIVITHNRKTMETADQLYGVTMEEAGMSKIVSVAVQQAFDSLKRAMPAKGAPPKPTQLFLGELD